jgi:hypothetical protein
MGGNVKVDQRASDGLRKCQQRGGAINALDFSPGGILWGLFIGVRGSGNNIRTIPLTVLFTISAQPQGYYSYFTHLSILYRTYYKVTRVFPGRGFHLMVLFRPSAPDRHPTPITTFNTGLRQHGCS